MKIINILKIAFKNILKNKMRSILTSLGIIIGVCSVVIMIAIGQGTQDNIQKQISSLGSNLLIISQRANRYGGISRGAGSENRLTFDDIDKIKKESQYIEWVSPMIPADSQVIANGNNWNTRIYGVSTDYLNIRNWSIKEGDFFKEQDSISNKKVAVLGKTIVDQLFPDQDPIGQTIRIGNIPFKVIGVLTAKGKSSFGSDQDDVILAPDKTVLTRLSGNRYIRMIYTSAYSSDKMSNAEEEIRTLLREQHKLKAEDEDDFNIGNQTEIAQTAQETTRIFTLLLGSIAGVSLLVGGIGIMNIMLVSVTERTREIGIRMAVGARKNDVMIQFLVEAVALSLSGGIIGTIVSFIICLFLNIFTPVLALINWNIILLSFLFSGSVGIFFGFYPARKAANLNPIDALRYE